MGCPYALAKGAFMQGQTAFCLQRAGCAVGVCGSVYPSEFATRDGREGVNLFTEHAAKITAVLMDLTMPNMMGDQAYGELRRLRADVPIVSMSGYTAYDIPIAFAQDPRARFLAKPFRAQALTDTLRAVLEA